MILQPILVPKPELATARPSTSNTVGDTAVYDQGAARPRSERLPWLVSSSQPLRLRVRLSELGHNLSLGFRAGMSRSNNLLTQQDKKAVKSLAKRYAPDWVLTIGLAAVFGALEYAPGFKREFSLEDRSLHHPFAVHERVPNWALFVIAVLSPAVLQLVVDLTTVRSPWDAHNSLLGLFLGLSLTGTITQITKVTVGRPRPDLIARCMPLPGAVDPPKALSTVVICTQTDISILNDGWRSFPSGHSSLSFAGLGFFSFYLAGKLHLFDRRGHARKAWVAITPLAGAALVAISRTMDYRHHWEDVTAGSILGLTMSYFSYRQYYPSLASLYSHRPYFPRDEDEGLSLPLQRTSQEAELNGRYESGAQYEDDSRPLFEGDEEEDMSGVPPGTIPENERSHLGRLWRDEALNHQRGQTV